MVKLPSLVSNGTLWLTWVTLTLQWSPELAPDVQTHNPTMLAMAPMIFSETPEVCEPTKTLPAGKEAVAST